MTSTRDKGCQHSLSFLDEAKLDFVGIHEIACLGNVAPLNLVPVRRMRENIYNNIGTQENSHRVVNQETRECIFKSYCETLFCEDISSGTISLDELGTVSGRGIA